MAEALAVAPMITKTHDQSVDQGLCGITMRAQPHERQRWRDSSFVRLNTQ
jgi:hypothetical protein